MTTKELIAQFNVVARTEYNRAYQEFEPKFKDVLFEYESGPVASVDFPFFGFLKGMEKFTGSRTHQTFPDGFKFTVTNEEWDMAVDIPRKDIERASNINSLKGLNPYRQRIAEMPKMVKDHPVELAFDMLEVGDASTYGTTFDGQNFFDTTHSYSTSAGTMSNIITAGAGVTTANLHTDFLNCMARAQTFVYQQGGDTSTSKKRKLNKTMNKILVVCPNELHGAFYDLQNKDRLASGESNTVKGKFEFISLPFSDATDWYFLILDDATFRPFLYQVEMVPELDMPTLQDENARENKTFTWGAYGRYAVAYGAWWTAIQVQNS